MAAPVPWIDLQCAYCGRTYQKPPSQAVKSNFCSRQCKDAAQTKTKRPDAAPVPERVADVGDVPYGYCHCGCGQKTDPAPYTSTKIGWIKGEPKKFIFGHINRGRPSASKGKKAEPLPELSDHFCECGCGQFTRYAPKTGDGYKKGEPLRFIRGHGSRVNRKTGTEHPRWSGKHTIPTETKYDDADGFCLCGCGERTEIAKQNDYVFGILKGQYYRYKRGHSHRVPVPNDIDALIIRELSANKRRKMRKQMAEGWYGVADVRAMFIEQDGRCFYCGESLEDGFDVDHRLPITRGGSEHRHNLVLACPMCNRRKWMRTEEEFRDYLAHGKRAENLPPELSQMRQDSAQRRTGKPVPWSRAHPELKGCTGCGTTEEKHFADGLCRPCWNKRRKEQRAAERKPKTWAKHGDFACCQECGTTERPHYGKGYCQPCYNRLFHVGAIPRTGKRSRRIN